HSTGWRIGRQGGLGGSTERARSCGAPVHQSNWARARATPTLKPGVPFMLVIQLYVAENRMAYFITYQFTPTLVSVRGRTNPVAPTLDQAPTSSTSRGSM